MHRTFQPLEQVDGHQCLQALLAVDLAQGAPRAHVGVVRCFVLLQPAGQDVTDRGIDGQFQCRKLFVDAVEVRYIVALRERALVGQRLAAFWKLANVLGVVEGLDMLAGTGNGHAVQQLEEVKAQRVQNGPYGPLLGWPLGPDVEGSLRTAKDLFHTAAAVQALAEVLGVAFVGQRQLVAQVAEAVVDRGGRQHQHFGLHTFPDDLAHQLLVACFLVLVDIVVAEIVRLVDDHQVIVAPVDLIERHAQRLPAGARQVGVAEHVVVEAVANEGVGLEVAVVGQPVVGQLLGAQHQHGAVA